VLGYGAVLRRSVIIRQGFSRTWGSGGVHVGLALVLLSLVDAWTFCLNEKGLYGTIIDISADLVNSESRPLLLLFALLDSSVTDSVLLDPGVDMSYVVLFIIPVHAVYPSS